MAHSWELEIEGKSLVEIFDAMDDDDEIDDWWEEVLDIAEEIAGSG